VPVVESGRLTELAAFTLFPARSAAWLSAIVSTVGVLLAAVGVYGLTACDAVRRRREIGIRLALGGRRTHVLQGIVRRAVVVAALGGAAGLMAAAALAGLLQGLLYDLPAGDPLSFVVASLTILVMTLAASFVPALRASLLDPLDAIRRE
jgi:ABC-type antimicrobial peptide transport system permease subunit